MESIRARASSSRSNDRRQTQRRSRRDGRRRSTPTRPPIATGLCGPSARTTCSTNGRVGPPPTHGAVAEQAALVAHRRRKQAAAAGVGQPGPRPGRRRVPGPDRVFPHRPGVQDAADVASAAGRPGPGCDDEPGRDRAPCGTTSCPHGAPEGGPGHRCGGCGDLRTGTPTRDRSPAARGRRGPVRGPARRDGRLRSSPGTPSHRTSALGTTSSQSTKPAPGAWRRRSPRSPWRSDREPWLGAP